MSVRITARPKGPLVVETDEPLEIHDGDGALRDVSGKKRVLFCRCGASASKPFCDGSHNRIGFECAPPPQEEDPFAGI